MEEGTIEDEILTIKSIGLIGLRNLAVSCPIGSALEQLNLPTSFRSILEACAILASCSCLHLERRLRAQPQFYFLAHLVH